jgi:lysozyme
MSAVDLAIARLKTDEGFRATKYLDSVGKLTIGYGFNIDAGITQTAAEALLSAQTAALAKTLATYWWAAGLDDARLSVVVEMAFNDGLNGLLHFPLMLGAIGRKDWQSAHDECLNSDAAHMLPTRYNALAQILLTGVCNGQAQAVA